VSARAWSTYLLDLPQPLRAKIEESAKISGLSMAEHIRQAICVHHGFECDPVEPVIPPEEGPEVIQGTGRMIIRLRPEVFDSLKSRAVNGTTFRRLVLDALEAHYGEEEQ
jgi:hypothetical protein